MTCADPFTRASQTYAPAAATAVRPHAVLQIGKRGLGLTARAIITGICLGLAIAPAIILTAMEHTR